ncbi:unnamed protein product [Lampetra fluviatilis]
MVLVVGKRGANAAANLEAGRDGEAPRGTWRGLPVERCQWHAVLEEEEEGVRSARTAPVIGSIQERGEEDYHPHSDGWAPGEQSDSRARQAALSSTGEPSAETTDERDWGHRGTAGGPGAAAESSEVHSPLRHRGEDDVDPEHPAIDKPSYRRFAAIPVNSLLLDQKAPTTLIINIIIINSSINIIINSSNSSNGPVGFLISRPGFVVGRVARPVRGLPESECSPETSAERLASSVERRQGDQIRRWPRVVPEGPCRSPEPLASIRAQHDACTLCRVDPGAGAPHRLMNGPVGFLVSRPGFVVGCVARPVRGLPESECSPETSAERLASSVERRQGDQIRRWPRVVPEGPCRSPNRWLPLGPRSRLLAQL